MGEDFQRLKKKDFEHRQDRNFRELKAPDIFSDRPEMLARAYTCEVTNGIRNSQADQEAHPALRSAAASSPIQPLAPQ
jgi:hypothetical protein